MERLRKFLLWALALFFTVGFILYPLAKLAGIALCQPLGFNSFLVAKILRAAGNSILLSLCTVGGSAIIGIWLAYTFHYKNIWKREGLSNLVLLPLAVPPMVAVMAYLFLLDSNGLLAGWFGSFNIPGWTAILIVHLYSFYTLPYLFVGNHLKKLDNSVLEAALMLGSSRTNAFFSVILPQLKRSLISSAMLVFMASMASFSAPFLFGGNSAFLSTEIYFAKINGNGALSAFLSVVLVLISIVVFGLFRYYSRNDLAHPVAKGSVKNTGVVYPAPAKAHSVAVLVFALLISLPIVSLLLISLLPENFQLNGHDYQFSLGNYTAIFTDPEFAQPLLNSILVSLTAVLLTLMVSFAVAFLLSSKKQKATSALELATILPYSIPGTVIAICLLLAFNGPSVFTFGATLAATFWILPIAYTIRNVPILSQALKTALQSLDGSLTEASTLLGASSGTTRRKILLPLTFGSLLEGILLVFINSFGEFVATVLLYTYDSKTIPIAIYAQIRLYNNGRAAAYGMLLFLLILMVIFLVRSGKKMQAKRSGL